MNKYEIAKANARQYAIHLQHENALKGIDYLTLFKQQEKLHKIGKRYGLIKEFKENGLL